MFYINYVSIKKIIIVTENKLADFRKNNFLKFLSTQNFYDQNTKSDHNLTILNKTVSKSLHRK